MSTPAAVRVYLRDWAMFRQIKVSVALAAIVQPAMFLLGVGLGIGELVDAGGKLGVELGEVGADRLDRLGGPGVDHLEGDRFAHRRA